MSLASVFEQAKQTLALAPLVGSVVQTVETALPDSAGKDKLAAAIKILTSVVDVAASLLPLIEKLVGAFVVIYGYNKSAQAQPAAPTQTAS